MSKIIPEGKTLSTGRKVTITPMTGFQSQRLVLTGLSARCTQHELADATELAIKQGVDMDGDNTHDDLTHGEINECFEILWNMAQLDEDVPKQSDK